MHLVGLELVRRLACEVEDQRRLWHHALDEAVDGRQHEGEGRVLRALHMLRPVSNRLQRGDTLQADAPVLQPHLVLPVSIACLA